MEAEATILNIIVGRLESMFSQGLKNNQADLETSAIQSRKMSHDVVDQALEVSKQAVNPSKTNLPNGSFGSSHSCRLS